MLTADPLYGPFEIPRWLAGVIATPEVQRLREVRLLNTSTPFFPALSDTRRFTHTIGVLHLALEIAPALRRRYPEKHVQAFLVSCVLHDVGTPAFAHIFEYILKSKSGWSHEAHLRQIIRGTYRPEGPYAQIYYSRGLRLHSVLAELELSEYEDLIASYVLGEGDLGWLISGSLDLDNIDNVYRMACLLGLSPDINQALELVRGVDVTSGRLSFQPAALPLVKSWQALRRSAYEILAFDESNLAGQAMLTELLIEAMEKSLLGEEHWHLTDEQLLLYLSRNDMPSELRDVAHRFATADYYATVFVGWYDQPKGERDLRLPAERDLLRAALSDRLTALSDGRSIPCCPYIFYDNGTFEKELDLRLRPSADYTTDMTSLKLGQTSQSTLVGVFTPLHRQSPNKRLVEGAQDVLNEFGFPRSSRIPIPDKRAVYELPGQTKLPV
jgi:HD superfamily phosphohydrolase